MLELAESNMTSSMMRVESTVSWWPHEAWVEVDGDKGGGEDAEGSRDHKSQKGFECQDLE